MPCHTSVHHLLMTGLCNQTAPNDIVTLNLFSKHTCQLFYDPNKLAWRKVDPSDTLSAPKCQNVKTKKYLSNNYPISNDYDIVNQILFLSEL